MSPLWSGFESALDFVYVRIIRKLYVYVCESSIRYRRKRQLVTKTLVGVRQSRLLGRNPS